MKNHYLSQWWRGLLTHICVTQPRLVKWIFFIVVLRNKLITYLHLWHYQLYFMLSPLMSKMSQFLVRSFSHIKIMYMLFTDILVGMINHHKLYQSAKFWKNIGTIATTQSLVRLVSWTLASKVMTKYASLMCAEQASNSTFLTGPWKISSVWNSEPLHQNFLLSLN